MPTTIELSISAGCVQLDCGDLFPKSSEQRKTSIGLIKPVHKLTMRANPFPFSFKL